jgi:nucleotide-binding universal stress UspA family protein
MATIKKILFPVDFSPACVGMAPFVTRAASMFSAASTLLHVVPPIESGFEMLVRPLPEIEENREDVARTQLNSFLVREFPLDASHRVLAAGDAARRIAEIARDSAYDLIVMPTHAGAFRRRLLGSTTAKVLDQADCPVLTTRHAETISPRPLQHREFLCAIGLNKDSERVLRYASEAADDVHANLAVVHAIPASVPGPSMRLELDERVKSAEEETARRRMEELQREIAPRARILISVGPVKDALIGAATRLRADVLVIGRSPQPGVVGRLRDLTYAIIRDAPCPVLSA